MRTISISILLISLSFSSFAQIIEPPIWPRPPHPRPPIIIIPPGRPVFHGSVEITAIRADVKIKEQVATTTIDIDLKNPTPARLEAEIVMPVPDAAAIKLFDFKGAGKEPSARLMKKEEARRIYNEIVSKMRDPAILEFAGLNLIRSCVFPVEPNGTQNVRLTYEQILEADGNRIDYFIPRSESLSYKTPWKFTVSIESSKPVSTVYSPTHEVNVKKKSATLLEVVVPEKITADPGPFRLSYLIESNEVSASLMAYPDPKTGGGYFLFLAGFPSDEVKKIHKIKRELTIVIDRSGSMRGDKIKQAREAASQVIAGLEEGEAFNLISYNEAVDMFSKSPVIKSAQSEKSAREYLEQLNASGGTNINDALVEALRQKPANENMLPIVLFLSDGLPTIGQTSEKLIKESVLKGNPFSRRTFTFGVGVDVNTPLLDKIATGTRAVSTYVLPKEDVELKVASVFKRLYGPLMVSPELHVGDANAAEAPGLVADTIPALLPDVFTGDQVIVLGRYTKEKPVTFKLSGNYAGSRKEFKFPFNFDKASTSNSFVPRLWASRKIALLIDGIRESGADPQTNPSDPKIKELVDEIVRLSIEFGILTEYTAFLAEEGTALADTAEIRKEAGANFAGRAMAARSGMGAVNQSDNLSKMSTQSRRDYSNSYLNEKMERVSVSNIQQMNDLSFYNRNGKWVDSRVASKKEAVTPDVTVEFGTKEFDELLTRLIKENRQGAVSLKEDIMLEVDGKTVLVKSVK
ncbi:MAG TPA: hypothetical protein DCZ94_12630 [Lentisphaeria bacterium]|nr:MAG: hypothetical protein A2X48_21320 [Lentisphaerae bacterium GWF2_49_21]HBC87792.1 hypothetical protein [Lentisphaeria bacterium]